MPSGRNWPISCTMRACRTIRSTLIATPIPCSERALHLLCLSVLSGFPQITLPLGAVHGAPFGISLLGPKGSDSALIRLGSAILSAAEGTH